MDTSGVYAHDGWDRNGAQFHLEFIGEHYFEVAERLRPMALS